MVRNRQAGQSLPYARTWTGRRFKVRGLGKCEKDGGGFSGGIPVDLDMGDPREVYCDIKVFGGPGYFDSEFSSLIIDPQGAADDVCCPLDRKNGVTTDPPKLQGTKPCRSFSWGLALLLCSQYILGLQRSCPLFLLFSNFGICVGKAKNTLYDLLPWRRSSRGEFDTPSPNLKSLERKSAVGLFSVLPEKIKGNISEKGQGTTATVSLVSTISVLE